MIKKKKEKKEKSSSNVILSRNRHQNLANPTNLVLTFFAHSQKNHLKITNKNVCTTQVNQVKREQKNPKSPNYVEYECKYKKSPEIKKDSETLTKETNGSLTFQSEPFRERKRTRETLKARGGHGRRRP